MDVYNKIETFLKNPFHQQHAVNTVSPWLPPPHTTCHWNSWFENGGHTLDQNPHEIILDKDVISIKSPPDESVESWKPETSDHPMRALGDSRVKLNIYNQTSREIALAKLQELVNHPLEDFSRLQKDLTPEEIQDLYKLFIRATRDRQTLAEVQNVQEFSHE